MSDMTFMHPNVQSRIIDDSVTFVTSDGLTHLFAAFPAERGPDNKIQLITSESEFNYYYGQPNMRKYGQTAYNVTEWLKSGGIASCMRVLPYRDEDEMENPLQPSTYACYILEAGLKEAIPADPEAEPPVEAELAQIKWRVRTLGDGRNEFANPAEGKIRDDLSLENIVLLAPDDPETDGYKYYPVLIFRGIGRGEYYNKFGVRIELNDDLDETYDFRTYTLTLYDGPTRVIDGPYTVSFWPEAQDASGASLFVKNVLETYSAVSRCLFSEANLDIVLQHINSDVTTHVYLDMIALQERNVLDTETYHVNCELTDGSEDLSPSGVPYIAMGGGTDGEWVGPNTLEALLFKAYSGTGDEINEDTGQNIYDTYFSDTLDKRAHEFDMTLDANYSYAIKVAMSNAARTRGDYFNILDTKFTGAPSQAEKIRRDNIGINTFFSAIFTQDLVVYDAYTGSDIRVTSPYFLAGKIPTHDRETGIQYPFTGPRRGTVAGYKSISWTPNEAWRERLYKAGVNYIEKDVEQTAFMPQKTAQLVNSQLSDINHVRVLLKIRRDSEKLCRGWRMEFNDAKTHENVQSDLNSLLQRWVTNRACEYIKPTVYASAYDKQQRIARVSIELKFTGVLERFMIDLVVQK